MDRATGRSSWTRSHPRRASVLPEGTEGNRSSLTSAATVCPANRVRRSSGPVSTSYIPEDGGPAGFYERLGFVPTGQLDMNCEVIVRFVLP